MTPPVDELKSYTWNSVAYPLWQTPRPQFEFFTWVEERIHYKTGYKAERDPVDDGHKGWLVWHFKHIKEPTRLELQKEFEEHFGEPGKHFRWTGACVKAALYEVFALGEYIQ